jgi:hypothetical protein
MLRYRFGPIALGLAAIVAPDAAQNRSQFVAPNQNPYSTGFGRITQADRRAQPVAADPRPHTVLKGDCK